MLKRFSFAALLVPLVLASPALAVTAKEKMATCKVGADSQDLKGAKRNAFITRCMGKGNYEPPARKNAKNAKPAKPAPAAAPAAPAEAGAKN